MENRGYRDIIGNQAQAPYINSLAAELRACHRLPRHHAPQPAQLPRRHLRPGPGLTCRSCPTWTAASRRSAAPRRRASSVRARPGRSYEESMPSNCDKSNSGAVRGAAQPPRCTTSRLSGCASRDVPYRQLAADLAARRPAGVLVDHAEPDRRHARRHHRAGRPVAGQRTCRPSWAASEYRAGTTAVFITWDEGSGGYPAEDCDDTASTDSSCRVPDDRDQPEHPGRHQVGGLLRPLLPAGDRGTAAPPAQAPLGGVSRDDDRRLPPVSRGCKGGGRGRRRPGQAAAGAEGMPEAGARNRSG